MLIFYLNFWRCLIIKKVLINHQIKAKEVRVIDVDGSQLGVLSLDDALKIADERGTDLIEISPTAVPPVCKVMDFGKYRFELTKKEKEAKKKQKVIETKEIRMSVNIDKHDIDIKVNNARKFLQDKHKVKVAVVFQGRELAYVNQGKNILDQFLKEIEDDAVIEKNVSMEGKSMMIILAPKK